MAPTRALSPPALSRRISVETPEHVSLDFELAGLGSRAAAAIYDLVLVAVLLTLVSAAVALSGILEERVGAWVGAVMLLVSFVVFWGYFVLFEGLWGGRTPGKRRIGIRVVMETGHPITFTAAATRNVVRLVDALPGPFLVGILFVLFHRHNKRLGDLVAGTVVVRDRPEDEILAAAPAPEKPTAPTLEPPLLSDQEFRLLDRYLARKDRLSPVRQARVASALAGRFRDRFPAHPGDLEGFLHAVHEAEVARRRQPRPATAGSEDATASRLVATKRSTWIAFRHRAAQIHRRGIRNLSGAELTAFAAAYREVAADLARARTYRADPRILDYLSRTVAAGHHALYGLRGVRPIPLRRLLLADFPAAVYGARMLVLAASLLFVVPGAVGYALIRATPELAYEILPEVAIARAETGARDQEAGRGYAETPSPYLPLVASGIIANNVQVAFGAFAFGVTAGIGTVFVLVFNGLFFGSVLGLFANYGLATWILTFVAGHGVLELTAIFVAGGAGMLIASAVIAPGDLSRRDALRGRGRRAIVMLGAATSLLVLAGVIEGFLSASDAPAAAKLAVSTASAVLVTLYFLAGRRAARAASR